MNHRIVSKVVVDDNSERIVRELKAMYGVVFRMNQIAWRTIGERVWNIEEKSLHEHYCSIWSECGCTHDWVRMPRG